MFRIFLFLGVVFVLGIGFAWIADNPGLVTITLPKQGTEGFGREVEVSLMVAVVALVSIVAVILITWSIINTIWRSPEIFSRWRRGRRRDKGYDALSKGMIAAAAGDAGNARKQVRDAEKLINKEPLVALLDAQTALLEERREVAQSKFETMLETPETRLLGLRGLYVEAERQGEAEAASHYAERAMELAPEASWASTALLRHQSTSGDWEGALKTLETVGWTNKQGKQESKRLKAVLLTAQAMALENSAPEKARTLAQSAHKLAPALVPAAVIAARISSRLGDYRKASKVLEATWKLQPHPEIAEAYVHVRSGDAATDRLKRARTLAAKRQNHVEGNFAIADAAIDARDWQAAREALAAILRTKPTERACLLMADIEEAEHGDRGRMRDWLSRAVRAPRDPAWTADGYISQNWAPISPISGKLDAFEWKVPLESLEGPAEEADYSAHATEPLAPKPVAELPVIAAVAATSVPVDAEPAETAADNEAAADTDSAAEDGATDQPAASVPVAAADQIDAGDGDTPQEAADIAAVDKTEAKSPQAEEVSTDKPNEAKPPIVPDDPGIAEDVALEPEPRRFKLF